MSNMLGVRRVPGTNDHINTNNAAAAYLGFCKESIPARACMAHRLPFGWRRADELLTKTNLEEESGYEFARRYR